MNATRNYTALALVFIGLLSAGAQPVDSLDLKIGQMILIGFPDAQVDADVLREIRDGNVGSIIIFEKNIPRQNSFIALKKIIWTYQAAAAIPLIVSIDQEGGRVNRLKDKYGFPRSITAEMMGRSPSLDSVRFYSEATAATLAGLGINMNFAPVVDLRSNPNNPIIARYGRSFSADEDTVAIMAREVILQHDRYGVLTALKHFPGHGSSMADTHLGIADVTATWEERELYPYKALIDSGLVHAVMSAHIVNRNLDPDGHPGTLSENILGGILRDRLHFDGVVFSDDMQMHAITEHYGLEEAIRLAIKAGIDIMTFSNNISGSDERTVARVHAIIRGLVDKGAISRERIDESFRRIMKLKQSLLQPNCDEQLNILQHELEQTRERLEKATLMLNEKESSVGNEQPAKKKRGKKNKG